MQAGVFVFYVCALVCIFVCLHLDSADAHASWLPTSGQWPLASNCKWIEALWESKPIYCPGNLSINGQPLAGVCHCLTLSGHFKQVLISHSQVLVLCEKTHPASHSKHNTQSTPVSVVLGWALSKQSTFSVQGYFTLWQYDKEALSMHQNILSFCPRAANLYLWYHLHWRALPVFPNLEDIDNRISASGQIWDIYIRSQSAMIAVYSG